MTAAVHAIEVVVDATLVFAAMLTGIGVVIEGCLLTLMLMLAVAIWVFVILRLMEKYDARDPFVWRIP